LNSPDNFILTDEEISVHKAIVDEAEKPQINNVHIKAQDYEKLFNNVKYLIEKKITLSETIQELVTDSLLQKWVDDGRTYHRDKLNKCAFCGGIITPERWEKIDAHFSKESEELKKAIENEMSALEKSKNYMDVFWKTENITKENYYSLLFSDYENIKNKWDNTVSKHFNLITKLLNKLQERYDDIFNPKSIEKTIDDVSSDIENVIEALNLLAEKNNEKSATLGEDKRKSRKLLRYSEIARFLSEINYEEEKNLIQDEEEKLSISRKNIEDMERKILNLEGEKKQEELKLNNEGEAVKKINAHILEFFGHDGLLLEPEIDGDDNPKTRFVIKRGNEIAYDLSEGECSLISFCYFIAKMEDELNGTEHEKLIIYIDDPISSLDSNHIFFMFSLIETVIARDKKYAQLFISTHNLDFLKYIKRLTIPYDNNKEQINHFVIEKRKNDISYRCFLIKMPSYLKDYVTEYNFLFKEIYNIAQPFSNGKREKYFENNYTLFYNLPNNMRRFLECYLFYRFPNTNDPLKNLGKIFNGHIPALINRVINEYSHLTWGDRGTLVMDIKEAETVAKEIIMVIMRDKEHFEALCESVGVDKNITIL
jgi:wobble nucleotide-excising tRNase